MEFTRKRNLALHVDGARIFNAVVAYGCELKELFDSIATQNAEIRTVAKSLPLFLK